MPVITVFWSSGLRASRHTPNSTASAPLKTLVSTCRLCYAALLFLRNQTQSVSFKYYTGTVLLKINIGDMMGLLVSTPTEFTRHVAYEMAENVLGAAYCGSCLGTQTILTKGN